MNTKSAYGILFDQVQIGPVTTQNRFFQVPHADGMGHLRPQAQAAMRKMKAEGGWGVVCTGEAEIHPTTDLAPYAESRIWDERDIAPLSLISSAVKQQGALAGIELAHNGYRSGNLYSRLPPIAPGGMPIDTDYPKSARAMDKADIKQFRAWHQRAARNARDAGFDIVYVYAGHDMSVMQQFLQPRYNKRSDEYGGSLENRCRFLREILEETKEEIGDTCAVALRFAVDESMGTGGMQAHDEGRAVVELLADLPDLWDVNVSDWAHDTLSTRFGIEEGYQAQTMGFVKQVTNKPVVGVGRHTSPDLMVKLIKDGVLDLIGAARPSIADPFLPEKIKTGRIEEIRECIGCNICASSDSLGVPIRCTQNPTMGEEWRRRWHPQEIEARKSEKEVLVVGSGPSGLECALQLGRRGYQVTLAEAAAHFGGRSIRESSLSGLGAWKRVADNRLSELQQMPNVDMFHSSLVDAAGITVMEKDKVVLATGARWSRTGEGRSHFSAIDGLDKLKTYTPDDIMDGTIPKGPVVIYDDDHGYMGGVIAQHLADRSAQVTLITSADSVSPFTVYTLEQHRIHSNLIASGVKVVRSRTISKASQSGITTACCFGGKNKGFTCQSLVLVTSRVSNNRLADELSLKAPDLDVEIIGDALMPGLIADATYSGHLAARNFEADPVEIESAKFRREMPSLDPNANFDGEIIQ